MYTACSTYVHRGCYAYTHIYAHIGTHIKPYRGRQDSMKGFPRAFSFLWSPECQYVFGKGVGESTTSFKPNLYIKFYWKWGISISLNLFAIFSVMLQQKKLYLLQMVDKSLICSLPPFKENWQHRGKFWENPFS